MSKVAIKFNGVPYEVEAGTSILKAAKSANINIPTLCQHPDLVPWAACGLCVVKVANSPKLVRACATEVVDGLEYITHDPELNEVRKTVVELILSSHPNECLTCGRNRTCELQRLASHFCIRESTYEEELRDLPVTHPHPPSYWTPENASTAAAAHWFVSNCRMCGPWNSSIEGTVQSFNLPAEPC